MGTLDDFATAIAEADYSRILDNIGITIKLPTLPTWPVYRDARRALYGTHRLSRFWMRRVFPWLRPRVYAVRVAAFEAAQVAHKAAFLNAVLERAEGELGDAE